MSMRPVRPPKRCKVCGETFRNQTLSYCSERCAQSVRAKAKAAYQDARKNRAMIRKGEIVEALGGHCKLCGGRITNLAAVQVRRHNGGSIDRDDLIPLATGDAPLMAVLKNPAGYELACLTCVAAERHPQWSIA